LPVLFHLLFRIRNHPIRTYELPGSRYKISKFLYKVREIDRQLAAMESEVATPTETAAVLRGPERRTEEVGRRGQSEEGGRRPGGKSDEGGRRAAGQSEEGGRRAVGQSEEGGRRAVGHPQSCNLEQLYHEALPLSKALSHSGPPAFGDPGRYLILQCYGSGSGPGIRCPFGPPDLGWVKNLNLDSRSGSWTNILYYISESLTIIFGVKKLKFLHVDQGSGNLFDPGSRTRVGKSSDLESRINIPDPHHFNFKFSSSSILTYSSQSLTSVMWPLRPCKFYIGIEQSIPDYDYNSMRSSYSFLWKIFII
jgi:hypothetical protein